MFPNDCDKSVGGFSLESQTIERLERLTVVRRLRFCGRVVIRRNKLGGTSDWH